MRNIFKKKQPEMVYNLSGELGEYDGREYTIPDIIYLNIAREDNNDNQHKYLFEDITNCCRYLCQKNYDDHKLTIHIDGDKIVVISNYNINRTFYVTENEKHTDIIKNHILDIITIVKRNDFEVEIEHFNYNERCDKLFMNIIIKSKYVKDEVDIIIDAYKSKVDEIFESYKNNKE